MEVSRIIFDPDSFGITQRSLVMLRNSLAERINHSIAVVEVRTSDLCLGYFIFDKNQGEAVWTGDGFRNDYGGEGGAGFITAEILFSVYGIRPSWYYSMQLNDIYLPSTGMSISDRLLKLAKEVGAMVQDKDFIIPAEQRPEYVRGLRR